jgi:hypothetical protein
MLASCGARSWALDMLAQPDSAASNNAAFGPKRAVMVRIDRFSQVCMAWA